MVLPCCIEVAIQGSEFKHRSDVSWLKTTETTAHLRDLEVFHVVFSCVDDELLNMVIDLFERDLGDVVALGWKGIAGACSAFSYAKLGTTELMSVSCCTSSVDT